MNTDQISTHDTTSSTCSGPRSRECPPQPSILHFNVSQSCYRLDLSGFLQSCEVFMLIASLNSHKRLKQYITKLQVANFQSCEHAVHQSQVWVKSQLALWLLLLMIIQLYHVPPSLPPPVSNSSGLFTQCQSLYANCCTVLFKVLYWVGKISWRRAWQPIPIYLPGESPWTGEPSGLQSMGSQRVRHDYATKHSTAL